MSSDQPVRRTDASRPTSHRRRVLLMIALGILPLLVLAAANLDRQVQEGEALVARDRVALATAAALTVSGFVDTSFATLQTLAATPTLSDPTSRPELTELLRQARRGRLTSRSHRLVSPRWLERRARRSRSAASDPEHTRS